MSNNKTNLNSIIKKKDNNKPSNFSEKKRKEVLFSLLPQINKLNKIKEQYNELIALTEKNMTSTANINNNNFSNKKKSISEKKLQKLKNNSVENLRNELQVKEKKIDPRKNFRKSISSITSKNMTFKNSLCRINSMNSFKSNKSNNSNNSNRSNRSNKTHRSFTETVINLNINKVSVIKKTPSEKKITPIPKKSLIQSSVNADLIKRVNKVIRRQEYNVQLKKTNITKLFGKRLIFIQRYWRKWFKNVYLKKVIKIQKVFRGHLIRKDIISDRLIIIRFVVKICLEGRKKYFYFFIGQMRKLIRAIFFKSMINTNDISIQVDIPIYKYIEKEINIKENKYTKLEEGEYEKLSKLLGKGNITGLKNFPRPYSEVGFNIKAFLRKMIKENNNVDKNMTKEHDMKYSGKTGQLIVDIVNKKMTLNKIQKNDIVGKRINYFTNNGNNVIKYNEEQLEEEIGEKKVFLKSKNINANEYDVLKSDKYISLIKKKVNYNKWNFYTKQCFYRNKIYKKELNERLKMEKKEEIIVKFGIKMKVFYMIFKECLVNHIRNEVLLILYPIELRIERSLKNSNSNKINSFFSLRRTTDNSDNASFRNYNKNNKVSKFDSLISNTNNESSVIFNDESIFVCFNKNNLNSETVKKYQITTNDLKYNNKKQQNK